MAPFGTLAEPPENTVPGELDDTLASPLGCTLVGELVGTPPWGPVGTPVDTPGYRLVEERRNSSLGGFRCSFALLAAWARYCTLPGEHIDILPLALVGGSVGIAAFPLGGELVGILDEILDGEHRDTLASLLAWEHSCTLHGELDGEYCYIAVAPLGVEWCYKLPWCLGVAHSCILPLALGGELDDTLASLVDEVLCCTLPGELGGILPLPLVSESALELTRTFPFRLALALGQVLAGNPVGELVGILHEAVALEQDCKLLLGLDCTPAFLLAGELVCIPVLTLVRIPPEELVLECCSSFGSPLGDTLLLDAS